MQENTLSRLAQFIKSKELSVRAFEQKAGLSNATISRAIKNNTSFAIEHLEKIILAFPDLDLNWLVKGENIENVTPYHEIDALIEKRLDEVLQKRGLV